MSNDEIHNRVTALERHLRNMRMAVIVVVAFFLYESLMPPELRPGRQAKIEDSVKTRELVLVNESGDARARLDVTDDGGARLVLRDGAGNRVRVGAGALVVGVRDGADVVEQLRVGARGIEAYDRAGNVVGRLP
ncbi:MAG: hypothetical protein OXU50_06570 [Gammaproteobacteria bacterium]|nr:hypothetical protein [Gammaproteobacteria bacterium]MDD9869539.1 hypothetical protein [Gammaproteobacteria bacterium]MDD9886525.1 hypothetical protein [Gammaproteobacteria bacterium]